MLTLPLYQSDLPACSRFCIEVNLSGMLLHIYAYHSASILACCFQAPVWTRTFKRTQSQMQVRLDAGFMELQGRGPCAIRAAIWDSEGYGVLYLGG